MILINLLPHREAARRRRLESFYASLGASALAGVVLAGLAYLAIDAMLTVQSQTNQVLQAEIRRLDTQIKDVATVQSDLVLLRSRQQAVEQLQTQRNQSVRLLNELVRQLPDGIYLTSMRQAGAVVTLAGHADSNERVSELLRNLGQNSTWLSSPELVEIVAANVNAGSAGATRVSNFSIRVQVRAPSQTTPGAASAQPATSSMPATPAAPVTPDRKA